MQYIKSRVFQRIFLPVLAALLLLSGQNAVLAQSAQAAVSAQDALVSEFDVNGLKVLIKKRPGSATVSAGLFIRGGSRNLAPQNAGIESFMASVATEGSQKFPRAELRRELARTAANISSGSNYDFSVFGLASTLESFDRSWELFTDVAMNPAFDKADVELTREKILTALRNAEDSPEGLLDAEVNRNINAKTAYANDPNGTVETIGRFKAEDLRTYHKNVMQTSRLLLVLVGNVDPEDIKARIAATLGKLPRGTYKETNAPVLDFSKPTLEIVSRNLPTNYVQGVFNAPSINSPDFYAMRVATTVLGNRLFEEVRVKRNLSYAPGADMGMLAANTGNISVSAVDANRAVGVMLDEIKKMKTDLVEPREISGVAGQFLTTYFIGQETNAAQAAELARFELIGGGWRNSTKFLDNVRKVSPEDVRRVSAKYMNNLRFVVVGNPQAIDRSIFLPNAKTGPE